MVSAMADAVTGFLASRKIWMISKSRDALRIRRPPLTVFAATDTTMSAALSYIWLIALETNRLPMKNGVTEARRT
jgi:hypothetical protein